MAVATAVRPAESVKEKKGTWGSIFPQEQLSETQSILFVKKLLAVAVSNITYLRTIFPEHAYGDRCLEDLNLKILRDDSSCPGACKLIKWVKGCFDALDKKYLRSVVLGIYANPEDPETVIESYTFKFDYQKKGGISIFRNDKKIAASYDETQTKKATIHLLRTLIVLTQSLNPLADNVFMTMKLLYYDDITPADYEPPGFKPADSDKFNYDIEPMNIKVGDVQTPFHIVKLRITTDKKQFEMKGDKEDGETEDVDNEEEGQENEDDDDAMVTTTGLDDENDKDIELEELSQYETNLVNKVEEMDLEKQQHSQKSKEPAVCLDVPKGSPAKPGKTETASTPASQISNQDDQEELNVRCPCGCNEEDGLMVNCEGCNFWQHAICFGMLDEDQVPDAHICELCADSSTENRQPTDFILYGMKPLSIQAMCLWRRALQACTEVNRVVVPTFAKRLGVEFNVAQGLVNRLQKEKFIVAPNKGKRFGKIVKKDRVINEGYKNYCIRAASSDDMNSSQSSTQSQTKEDSQGLKQKSSMTTKINEVEKLTEKTSEIDVSAKVTLTGKTNKPQRLHEILSQERVRYSPRLQKRKIQDDARTVVAMSDQSEFEISNSQDCDDFRVGRSTKRRKASTVGKTIMV